MADETRPALPTIGKFDLLRTELFAGQPSAKLHRSEFLDSAIDNADGLRIREEPKEDLHERVTSDLRTFLPLRDQLIDWLQIEATTTQPEELQGLIVDVFERLLAHKFRPEHLNSWNDA